AAMHPPQRAADGERRVEAARRILRDEGDARAADAVELLVAERREIVAVEDDLACRDGATRRHQPEEGPGGDALATAGLANDPARLAWRHVDRHVLHDGRAADGACESLHRDDRHTT